MLWMGFAQNIVAIVFIVLALFSIFVLFSQIFLQSYFADVTLQSLRTQNPTKTVNEQVVAINSTLRASDAIQQGYHHWSPLIVLMANTFPESARIRSMKFIYSSNTLEVAGTVPSREALLEFKNSLEALDQIDMVTVPLSDLTKHNEISFSLTIPFSF